MSYYYSKATKGFEKMISKEKYKEYISDKIFNLQNKLLLADEDRLRLDEREKLMCDLKYYREIETRLIKMRKEYVSTYLDMEKKYQEMTK